MACVGNTSCVQAQIVGGALRLDAVISPDSQNALKAAADGLTVPLQRGPMARMYGVNGLAGNVQTPTNATLVQAVFNQLSYDVTNDPLGQLQPSADVANSRFLIRRAGHYQIGFSTTWKAPVTTNGETIQILWTTAGGVVVPLATRTATIGGVAVSAPGFDVPQTVSTVAVLGLNDQVTFNLLTRDSASVYNPYPPYGHMAWLNFLRS